MNPFRYRGYYYDESSGLYYLNSRYYDANAGRFINADGELSGGGLQGYNLFAYCLNNPVNMSDPSGHWPEWGTFISGIISIGIGIAAIAAVVATGGAATPLVAAGLALTATAGSVCVATGACDTYESFTGDNPYKNTIGADNYNTMKAVGLAIATAGAACALSSSSTAVAEKTAVIGQSMDTRVIPYANDIGAEFYKGVKSFGKIEDFLGKPIANSVGAIHNASWIVDKMAKGYKIIDIGLDPGKTKGSFYYGIERVLTSIYSNKISLFP